MVLCIPLSTIDLGQAKAGGVEVEQAKDFQVGDPPPSKPGAVVKIRQGVDGIADGEVQVSGLQRRHVGRRLGRDGPGMLRDIHHRQTLGRR